MKTLYRYSLEKDYNNQIIAEVIKEISSEMICESFKSTILTKLANRIKEEDKEHNDKIKDQIIDLDEYTGKKRRLFFREIKSFSTIFGPHTNRNAYKAIKWSEISDDDFKQYNGNDSELAEYLKNSNEKDYMIIVCKKNTKDIIYVIQILNSIGFSFLYWFNKKETRKTEKGTNWESIYRKEKANEGINNVILRFIGKNDAYILEITKDMTQEYKNIINKRAEDKKGMINYDEESLKELQRKQEKRYEEIILTMKAEKLKNDPVGFFDEIKKVQDQISEIYKKVITNIENIDKFNFLGCIMHELSACYSIYLQYLKNSKDKDNKYSNRLLGDATEILKRAKDCIKKFDLDNIK